MKVKLCGFTDANSVKTAVENKCDFIGFVFCEKSPRFISVADAVFLSSYIPSSIKKVAVVRNTTFAALEEIAAKFSPDFFQFHGSENPDFLQKVKKEFPHIKIIKAFAISRFEDLAMINEFMDCADIFLLDNKEAGSGVKFDWEFLQDFNPKKEWFLSGGINMGNVAEVLKLKNVKMIDVSSGIEKEKGIKSLELIKDFMAKIHNLNVQN